MDIAIVGTGFIATTLGRALGASGHTVTYGSRHPDQGEYPGGRADTVGGAIAGAEVVVLAVPGAAVAEVAAEHADALVGRVVIDATNHMGAPVNNARADLPPGVRYARAFNTLGGEVMADPVFGTERADGFFTAPEEDAERVGAVVEGVGLRPVYLGADKEALCDGLFAVWIALAVGQGRGRRIALRLLDGAPGKAGDGR